MRGRQTHSEGGGTRPRRRPYAPRRLELYATAVRAIQWVGPSSMHLSNTTLNTHGGPSHPRCNAGVKPRPPKWSALIIPWPGTQNGWRAPVRVRKNVLSYVAECVFHALLLFCDGLLSGGALERLDNPALPFNRHFGCLPLCGLLHRLGVSIDADGFHVCGA